MATNYPYTSAQGALVKAFEQFKKAFPATLDAATLKRFNIAPANESYVINTFRFLGIIDDSGKRVDGASDIFYGSEDVFKAGLDALMQESYSQLFQEHGAEAWKESRETLAVWFRVADKTSDLIGARQAATFLTVAALAGHGEPIKATASSTSNGAATTGGTVKARKPAEKSAPKKTGNDDARVLGKVDERSSNDVGLTVRIEVNLPAGGTPEVYDAIFASIRKNLLDRD